jgi:uroporphyrinogen-III synthase
MKHAVQGKRPLAGVRVLVTRAQKQAGALSKLLAARGAEVTEIPVIEMQPPVSFAKLDRALINIESYDWLILTSVNGVEPFFSRMRIARIPAKRLKDLKIAAIGPATRAAIKANGVRVAVMPDEYVAESVVKALRKQVKGKRVLLVRARVARDVIPRELSAAGAEVEVVEAYRTTIPRSSAAKLKRLLEREQRAPHVITFTSSSTARNFVKLLGAATARRVTQGIALASIGPVTSQTLDELRLPATVEASEFTMHGLVSAIEAAFRD